MLTDVLRDESIAGKLIVVAAILALVVVNSPLGEAYEAFWHTTLTLGLGDFTISQDLRHWVSEGLMAFFFLVVGLEIKRELVHGELRDRKTAALPIAAAIGGMIVPALIYISLNMNPETARGWGIPIATDIAFAVGILMLLGKRVPSSLKLFLLTLAIADDIGAIIVIGLFYAEIIHVGFLMLSAALVLSLWLFRKQLAPRLWLFGLLAVLLWVTTHLSGIHASIVGAAVGLLAPMRAVNGKKSIAEWLEKAFLPLSTFVALPVFAFASAGVVLTFSALGDSSSQSVFWGVILGLVLGKMIGIVAATWLMVRFGKATLPHATRWQHIVGVGFIAGIGFTVSIFITELAFSDNNQLMQVAKIAIFIASAMSAIIGSLLLLKAKPTG